MSVWYHALVPSQVCDISGDSRLMAARDLVEYRTIWSTDSYNYSSSFHNNGISLVKLFWLSFSFLGCEKFKSCVTVARIPVATFKPQAYFWQTSVRMERKATNIDL